MKIRLLLNLFMVFLVLGLLNVAIASASAANTVYVVPGSYNVVSVTKIDSTHWDETISFTVTNTTGATTLPVRLALGHYNGATGTLWGNGATGYTPINATGNTTVTFVIHWTSPTTPPAGYQIFIVNTPAFRCSVGNPDTTVPITYESPHYSVTFP